jgi:hypothetical protein
MLSRIIFTFHPYLKNGGLFIYMICGPTGYTYKMQVFHLTSLEQYTL